MVRLLPRSRPSSSKEDRPRHFRLPRLDHQVTLSQATIIILSEPSRVRFSPYTSTGSASVVRFPGATSKDAVPPAGFGADPANFGLPYTREISFFLQLISIDDVVSRMLFGGIIPPFALFSAVPRMTPPGVPFSEIPLRYRVLPPMTGSVPFLFLRAPLVMILIPFFISGSEPPRSILFRSSTELVPLRDFPFPPFVRFWTGGTSIAAEQGRLVFSRLQYSVS